MSKPSHTGYTKSGDEHRSDASQSLYSKDNHYEGNMGHNMTTQDYEPTHVIDKQTGAIKGAGVN